LTDLPAQISQRAIYLRRLVADGRGCGTDLLLILVVQSDIHAERGTQLPLQQQVRQLGVAVVARGDHVALLKLRNVDSERSTGPLKVPTERVRPLLEWLPDGEARRGNGGHRLIEAQPERRRGIGEPLRCVHRDALAGCDEPGKIELPDRCVEVLVLPALPAT